jgi:hypothetical protein
MSKRYERKQDKPASSGSSWKARPTDGIWLEGESQHTNWRHFASQMLALIGQKYGEVSLEMETGKLINYAGEAIDLAGVDKPLIPYTISLWTAANAQQKAHVTARFKAFNEILMHISPSSERKIQTREEWTEVATEHCPMKLWRLLSATHQAPTHLGVGALIFQRKALTDLKMKSANAIDQFSDLFKRTYEDLKALGDKMYLEPEASQLYMLALHEETFGLKVADLIREGRVPATLNESIQMITQWYYHTMNTRQMMAHAHAHIDPEDAKAMKASSHHDSRETAGRRRDRRGRRDHAHHEQSEGQAPIVREAKATREKLPICPFCQKPAKHRPEECFEIDNWTARTKADREKAKQDRLRFQAREAQAAPEPRPKTQGGPSWMSKMIKAPMVAIQKLTAKAPEGEFPIYLDSGANTNVWPVQTQLLDVRPIEPPISIEGIAGNSGCSARGTHPDWGNVLIIPIDCGLISLSQITKTHDIHFVQDAFTCTSKLNSRKVSFKLNHEGMYELAYEDRAETQPRAFFSSRQRKVADKVYLACRTLGHPGLISMITTKKYGGLSGFDITEQDIRMTLKIFGPCESCVLGKLTSRDPSPYEPTPEPDPTIIKERKDTLHADFVFLPGAKGTRLTLLVSVAHESRLIHVCLMSSRNQASLERAWMNHIARHGQGNITITSISTDNEPVIGATSDYLATFKPSIRLVQAPSESHEPFVERRIRVIKERMRSVITDADYKWNYKMPNRLIVKLTLWVVQAINCTIDTIEDGPTRTSAEEKVSGIKPDFGVISKGAFGDMVYYHSSTNEDMNLKRRGNIGILVGRSMHRRRFRIYDPAKDEYVTRRSFIVLHHSHEPTYDLLNKYHLVDQGNQHVIPFEKVTDVLITRTREAIDARPGEPDSDNDEDDPMDEDYEPEGDDKDSDGEDDEDYEPIAEDELETPAVPEHPLIMMAAIQDGEEDNLTPEEAIKRYPEMATSAIQEEMEKLLEYGAFVPAPPASIRGAIPSKMFLKMKFDAWGTFTKMKARLVAGGHRQHWADDQEKSSPTAKWTTARTMIALAAQYDLTLTIADVKSAYLNAPNDTGIKMIVSKTLAEFLFARNPEWRSLSTKNGGIVVELKKALYGLKDSGRQWNLVLAQALKQQGLIQATWDKCLFVTTARDHDMPILTVLTNVDDLMILSRDQATTDELIARLEQQFGPMDVQRGDGLSYLGATIQQSVSGVSITCAGYERKLMEKFGVDGTADTPAPSSLTMKTLQEETTTNVDITEYLSVVMSLMYLALRCRPDILTVVEALATSTQNPTEAGLKVAARCLRYINGSIGRGITFSRDVADRNIHLFADASYNCHADAKSQGGCIAYYAGGAIDYQSTKQKCVARSAYEAELIALDSAIERLLVLDFTLREILPTAEMPRLYQDNEAAILAAREGPKASLRSAMNVRFQWIKEQLDHKRFDIQWTSTLTMAADGLTKILHGEAFQRSTEVLMPAYPEPKSYKSEWRGSRNPKPQSKVTQKPGKTLILPPRK